MSVLIDSSVWVSAMVQDELWHSECAELLNLPEVCVYAHGLSEVFSTLTGGRRGFRMPASLVTELIERDYLPSLISVSLDAADVLFAMGECQGRGVAGAAFYDFLHLSAARKSKCRRIYTLNLSHFKAFWRVGDPEICHPSEKAGA